MRSNMTAFRGLGYDSEAALLEPESRLIGLPHKCSTRPTALVGLARLPGTWRRAACQGSAAAGSQVVSTPTQDRRLFV